MSEGLIYKWNKKINNDEITYIYEYGIVIGLDAEKQYILLFDKTLGLKQPKIIHYYNEILMSELWSLDA